MEGTLERFLRESFNNTFFKASVGCLSFIVSYKEIWNCCKATAHWGEREGGNIQCTCAHLYLHIHMALLCFVSVLHKGTLTETCFNTQNTKRKKKKEKKRTTLQSAHVTVSLQPGNEMTSTRVLSTQKACAGALWARCVSFGGGFAGDSGEHCTGFLSSPEHMERGVCLDGSIDRLHE